MYILGLNGSPNTDGNVNHLLEIALNSARDHGASEIEIIQIGKKMMETDNPFCSHCSNPCEDIECADSNINKVISKLGGADGIILGSPVYFGTVSGQLKAFWDKTRALRTKKKLLDVPGGAIAVGGARFGGQETTLRTLHDMMLIQGMTVVGDGSFSTDAGHQGPVGQKNVKEDDNACNRAKILGERIVQTAKKLKSN